MSYLSLKWNKCSNFSSVGGKKCGFIGSVDVLTPYDLFIVTAAMLDDWQESLYKMWIVDIDTKDDSSKHWFRGEDLLKFLQ